MYAEGRPQGEKGEGGIGRRVRRIRKRGEGELSEYNVFI